MTLGRPNGTLAYSYMRSLVMFIFFSRVLKLLTLPRGSAATSRIAATEREAVQPHGFGKASLKALLSRMKVLVLAVSFCQVLCIFMNFNVTINS